MIPTLVFYISGHGFGHASRQIEVINALRAQRSAVRIVVRSAAARWLFDLTAQPPIEIHPVECDTGIAQIDSLRLDAAASIRRAAAFHRDLDARARAEAAALRELDAALVVADVPPLACAAAAEAGVPAIVIANFTWDWIYEGYPDELAEAPGLVPRLRDAYRTATAAWRLPLWGGFEPFRRVIDLPFIARHARRERSDTRRRYGLPLDRPLLLVSFGGYGLDRLDLSAVARELPVGVVVMGELGKSWTAASGDGLYYVDEDRLYADGFRYEDLVAAVDIVLTKPGYGIVAECIANGAAMLYTSRGRFREYDVFVAEMARYLQCRFIDQQDLFAGRWRHAIEPLLASPPPPERAATNGADIAAAWLLDLL